MRRILAADIGATHTRFALFRAHVSDVNKPLLCLEHEIWFKSGDFSSFSHVLQALRAKSEQGAFPLNAASGPLDMAVMAPAGPVEDGACAISNLPWVVHVTDAKKTLASAQVEIINDFQAQTQACLLPDILDPVRILPQSGGPPLAGNAPLAKEKKGKGARQTPSPVAVMGAGTGFGKALLLPHTPPEAGESRTALLKRLDMARILPSEGGHCDFPFMGKEEYAFAEFLRKSMRDTPLTIDRVVSGSGLACLFAFFSGKRLPAHEVPIHIDRCPQALEAFARFYGRVCRNFLLETLALGGAFLTGGMALRVPVLEHPAFAGEFYKKTLRRPLLEQTPVWHVKNPAAGLWGAALHGLVRLWAQKQW